MRDLPGKIIGIIITFFLLVVCLFSITVVEDAMLDRRALYIDMCDFVDSVVDSRQITDAELKSFDSKIASYGLILDYDIERKIRVVNPDPLNAGEYVVSYLDTSSNRTYSQGDKIVLHVRSYGLTPSQNIARSFSSIWIRPFDETVAARIR